MPPVVSLQSSQHEEAVTTHRESMLGDYDVLDLLGEGAFAQVYKCEEKSTKRTFAAKRLELTVESADRVGQFEHEVEILRELKNENIVSLHSSFRDENYCYLILEYVDGGTLFDEVIREAVFNEKQACRLIKQVLLALEYLHQRRIVHRDIKPDNLLLKPTRHSPDNLSITSSQHEDDVIVKLTDFGLSRKLPEGSETIRCEPSGAPMFLAPETILDEPVGCAVDMWAIGVILYLILVGYPPFWSSSDEQLLLTILQGRYSMPSPYWDNIKPHTKQLVSKLIVQQPEMRLTASQALKHHALSDNTLGRKVSVVRETKRNFLAVACGIRAMVKFKRANVKSASRRLSERGEDLKSPTRLSVEPFPYVKT